MPPEMLFDYFARAPQRTQGGWGKKICLNINFTISSKDYALHVNNGVLNYGKPTGTVCRT